MSAQRFLAGLGLVALGFTAGVIADVRVGTATIWDEAANGSTPTGRAFRNDVQDVIGREVERIEECMALWGNPYCLDEWAPVP